VVVESDDCRAVASLATRRSAGALAASACRRFQCSKPLSPRLPTTSPRRSVAGLTLEERHWAPASRLNSTSKPRSVNGLPLFTETKHLARSGLRSRTSCRSSRIAPVSRVSKCNSAIRTPFLAEWEGSLQHEREMGSSDLVGEGVPSAAGGFNWSSLSGIARSIRPSLVKLNVRRRMARDESCCSHVLGRWSGRLGFEPATPCAQGPRPATIRNFLQRRTSKSLIHQWIWRRDPLFGGFLTVRPKLMGCRPVKEPCAWGVWHRAARHLDATARLALPASRSLMRGYATQGFAGCVKTSPGIARLSADATMGSRAMSS
jgi:hypothetical protein